MSNKDARDKGLIWSRRTEVLSLMGGKDQEWNEINQKAVVSGVKAQLELREGKEIIVNALITNEEEANEQKEASVEHACKQPENASRKRAIKQKPLKTPKRRRK